MTSKQTWGRKETIIWPPHAPIYTFSAFALGFLVTVFFVWQHLRFSETPLQQTYTTTYVETLVGATFNQTGTYRLLYVGGGKAAPRLAMPADFLPGETVLPSGNKVPVMLSDIAKHQGRTIFFQGPAKKYDDAALSRWLHDTFFEGHGLLELYGISLAQGLLVFLIALPFGVRADVRRFRELKYGRRLKGPIMLDPAQFNRALKADGLGIETTEKPKFRNKKSLLRIPKIAEAKHIQIMGDTGTGKSTIIKQLLQQIADRGEVAIVYDPAGEFTETFYKESRGDWILNPLDKRAPYWTPSSELKNPAEARTIAASMYQPREDKRGEFFTDTPQKIFAHLLKYKPTPEQLVEWMSDEKEIDRRLEGTELANFAPKNAPQQRAGVLASLGLVADSLRLLPSREEAHKREWSATEWADKREGWIFLTSTEAEQEALRPLHSLWIDLLVLRLLTKPKPKQNKAWLVIDELASLQRLPQFHTALTKGRKSDNPIVFGYQGKAQLESIYGHLAEVMLSQPTTKFILRTAEPNAAKWAVNGYAAPQLHTHAVIFNVTEREDGSTRALQPQALFDSQNYATAVYQSALTLQLRKLGYEIEPGQSGAPEIKGYSLAYLDASSPRSQQIKEQMEKAGFQGPEAAQIAAHSTRDRKQTFTAAEVLAAHKEMATEHGNQPQQIIAATKKRALSQAQPGLHTDARGTVAFAREKVFEREAVADERLIMREALRRGMGEVSFEETRDEFQRRRSEGEFQMVQGQKHSSGRSFTTPETIAAERANVQHVLNGQGQAAPMLADSAAEKQATSRDFLNEKQQTAIREVLTSTDRVHGFQGLAGTGKTTTLEAIREGAEQGGYKVEGFAPTSKAARQLREAGIEATTLQSFLARQKESDPASRHLYMLDESSLASTKQMRAFLEKIKPEDRVLVIGDTRQHQGVDAGRPFQQMQEAGMQTAKLDTIMRQKDPELLRAVQHLAMNETEKGIALLADQGRVTQLANAPERIAAIAKDYAAKPENTIIVSPDNKSRQQINEAVRGELLKTGMLAEDGRQFLTLSHRSDMTGPDRTWAAMYKAGDVVQYEKGSKAEGIERGSFAVVRSSDGPTNRLTVELGDGSTVAYDPKRVYGVNVFRETSREFATGDRLQFSALNKELGLSNRDMGTITKMELDRLTVLMDGKEQRSVSFDSREFRQFDHGYAVTSHSAQGLTTTRVIVNIDTDSSRSLINTRLAYVAISRASEDARIYTNNAGTLGQRLATDVTKTAALDFKVRTEQPEAQFSKVPKAPTVHEYNNSDSRLAAVAADYATRPERSIMVAPDRAEREELTQLARADLYSKGQLGRDAQAVPVLVEKEAGSRRRAEAYEQGDKIHYKTGSPGIDHIPHDTTATVLSTTPKRNLITVQIDNTRETVTYNPAELGTQTRESRLFQEETREIVEGERIRFTRHDKQLGVHFGDLGTVTRAGQDRPMTVQLDSGKTVQVSPEKSRHIDYGYAVESMKGNRAERVIATGDGLTQQVFQGASPKADQTLYTGTPAPAQEFSAAKELTSPEISQPARPQQHDFGIGF